ncbi:hypothetical protein [Echinicola vietnamensis]|uniref:Outer membrane protein beta-barrel domain-containing protein n=1 Tax=Echinicola vietnamensis (strain DSM 17526 / LMG 23754 / KMM 6221) TaxID=926556 RepID=L0FWH6_ECHVK|nr:hypothetical protein [Echinicola vietnamensis]AGA77398.1 hypothetical protein Echvi_1127 [Echinicola vietnamensis DSM 17526]
MNIKYSVTIIFFILLIAGQAMAQEEEEPSENETLNRVVFSLGYTWIPQGDDLDQTESEGGYFVPAVGFDYFRKVHERWEIGVMWDWELEHYIIRNEDLERERSMLFALVANYELTERWALFGGGGIELEKHENLPVFRVGTEYAIDMGQQWELLPSFALDIKRGYNTWNLAVGFCKRF